MRHYYDSIVSVIHLDVYRPETLLNKKFVFESITSPTNGNSVIIYSPSCHFKPVCGKKKKTEILGVK